MIAPPLAPPSPERDALAQAARFFAAARAGFARANRPAATDHTWVIGGSERLRIRFGSLEMAEHIAPAFAHLSKAPADGLAPDFTIDAWDEANSDVPMPVSPWQAGDYDEHGELRQEGWPKTLRARFNVHSGILSMVDATERSAIWWMRDALQLVEYERAAPFALLLHWWYLHCPPPGPRTCAVHAAVIGLPDRGGLLLTGRSGSGKSTSALACLAADFQHAGDDHCLVRGTTPHPTALSLYSTAKMDDAMLARFPVFRPAVANPARPAAEKALLFLGRAFAGRCAAQLPLKAIVLPRVQPGSNKNALVPATAIAAMQALAPSTIFLFPRLPGEAASLLAQLADLSRRLPAFHLHLGTNADPGEVPAILTDLLDRLPAPKA